MRQRSSYPKPFKAQVVQECLQPGATVSSVAISHGINANVIRKWLPLYRDQLAAASLPAFVPLETAPSRSSPERECIADGVIHVPCLCYGRHSMNPWRSVRLIPAPAAISPTAPVRPGIPYRPGWQSAPGRRRQGCPGQWPGHIGRHPWAGRRGRGSG